MNRRHFEAMAEQLRAIAAGEWTSDKPAWYRNPEGNEDIERASTVAESFIMLAKRFNPLFDDRRFLQAAGLVEVDARKGRKVRA